MSRNEIEQKIRDLKTRLSCQESDIGDWKVAKCMEYSTLGLRSVRLFGMRLMLWKRSLK